MNIALDFDDTFTVMPNEWASFVKMLQAVNNKSEGSDYFKVYVVTSRFATIDSRQLVNDTLEVHGIRYDVTPVFCDHNPKYEHCKKQGINIDIWIDDNPWCIVGVDKPNSP